MKLKNSDMWCNSDMECIIPFALLLIALMMLVSCSVPYKHGCCNNWKMAGYHPYSYNMKYLKHGQCKK